MPLPPGIPIDRHRIMEVDERDLKRLVPPDRAVMARIWGRARAAGTAVGPVRLQSDPEVTSSLYFLDLRHRYGTMIGLFAEGERVDESVVRGASAPGLPPRAAHAVKDESSSIKSVDPALTEILGWAPDELVGRRAVELVHPEDRDAGIASWMEMLDSPGSSRRVRVRYMHHDGYWVWMEVTNENRLSDDHDGCVASELVDISDEMSALEALRAREQLLGQLTETVPVGLFHVDLEGNLLFANRRFQEITGADIGATLAGQVASVLPEDRPRLEEAIRVALAGAPVDVEIRTEAHHGDGVRHCAVSVRPLRNESGAVSGVTGCIDDVTLDVLSRRQLEEKATTDPLTGCLNRLATLAALQELLDRPHSLLSAPRSGTAAIFVDIDRLKPVNDVLGHAAGDELLVRAAQRIQRCVRSGDLVGRLGGDEFLVVCPGVSSAEDASRIAEALASRAFGRKARLPGGSVTVRASMGVSWTDAPGARAEQLVREADAAMYRSKRRRHSDPVVFRQPET